MDGYSTCTGDNYGDELSVLNAGIYDDCHKKHCLDNRPILKRIFVAQELVQNDSFSPRILRQYSYQEIHTGSSRLMSHTSYVEPSYSNSENLKALHQSSTQEEPMEVDTSFDSLSNTCNPEVGDSKEVKFSSNYNSTQDTMHHRKAKPKAEDRTSSLPKLDELFVKKKRKEVSLFVRLILAVIVIAALLLFFVYMVFDYNAYVDINALENEFAQRLHEQKDAVHAIVNSLRYNHPHAQWHKPVKILNFVGRSGVGKTLIANILKLHFNYLFVNDLHSTELHNVATHESIIGNLYSSYMNLIIIDDLNVDNLDPLINFIEKLEKQDTLILVIAIFSIQKVDDELNSEVYYDDIFTIHKKFDQTGFYHEVIAFDEFTIADAREYIGKKLSAYNVNVQYHNNVANRILEGHDINRDGFKDLHFKVLNEINRLHFT